VRKYARERAARRADAARANVIDGASETQPAGSAKSEIVELRYGSVPILAIWRFGVRGPVVRGTL